MGAGSFDGMNKIVKTPHGRCISINVWKPHQLVYQLDVCTEVINKAPKMGNNEIYVRILRRDHFNYSSLSSDIIKDRHPKCPGNLASFPRKRSVCSMSFDSSKSPLDNCLFNHLIYPPLISGWMYESKANVSIGVFSRQARHVGICCPIITMRRGENDCFIDPSSAGPRKVGLERSIRVPRVSETVPLPKVAVAVNNHSLKIRTELAHAGSPENFAFIELMAKPRIGIILFICRNPESTQAGQ